MPNINDELNILSKEGSSYEMRSMDYEEFFRPMRISKAQKKRRIEMAEKLEDKILFILSLIAVLNEYSEVDWDYITLQFKNAYMDVLGGAELMDDYTIQYVKDISQKLADSTKENITDPYTVSYDRARLISENEAATLINHQELVEALALGKTKKQWLSMRDKKVRHTHVLVDGKTLRIEEPFLVGDSLMMIPRDSETYGASAKEVVNCRCACKYL